MKEEMNQVLTGPRSHMLEHAYEHTQNTEDTACIHILHTLIYHIHTPQIYTYHTHTSAHKYTHIPYIHISMHRDTHRHRHTHTHTHTHTHDT